MNVFIRRIFQFYDSTIKSGDAAAVGVGLRHFNSTIVQLRAVAECIDVLSDHNFNSTIVQLRGAKGADGIQYYNISILR